MKQQPILVLLCLLLICYVLCHPLTSRGQGETSVTVNNAETTAVLGLTSSAAISAHWAAVPALVLHAFSEANNQWRLQIVPAPLANLLDQLSPTVIFGANEANYRRVLTTVPPALQRQLAALQPFVLFTSVEANVSRPLTYPAPLLNDTVPPQIADVGQIAVNGIAYLRWTTNEFTRYALSYGVASGVYTEQVNELRFAKEHLFNIMALTPEFTYYAKLTLTDRSGNSRTTAEFTIERDTTQYLYLPLITR